MLRKITIAVDCVDDKERDAVQRIMNDVSSMRFLQGNRIIGMYPYFKRHEGELYQLFNLVGERGVKALLSGQGISLVTKLAKG